MRIHRFNGSFLLLILATLAVVSLVISLLVKLFPLVFAKAFYFCQQVISNTFIKIPDPLQNIFFIILLVALVLGSLSFAIQLIKTKQLVRMLMENRIMLPKRIRKMTTSLDLSGKVYVIEDNNCFSFCAGALHPRILITTALIIALTDKELESVLLHEKAHIRNYDPFKMLFGKTISWLFFFLPIFSEINKNMQATSEILADRFVISFQQNDTHLRSALKKILMTPQINFALSPAIANPDFLEIRINRLVNPAVKHYIGISWKNIFSSALFILISSFLLQTQVSAIQMEGTKESNLMCSSENVSTSTLSTSQDLFSPQLPNYKSPYNK